MKIPKLTQKQRWIIYQLLEKEFWKNCSRCMKLEEWKLRGDKYCGMGLNEFVCNEFVMMNNDRFKKMIEKYEMDK